MIPRILIIKIINSTIDLIQFRFEEKPKIFLKFFVNLALVCREWKESVLPRLTFSKIYDFIKYSTDVQQKEFVRISDNLKIPVYISLTDVSRVKSSRVKLYHCLNPSNLTSRVKDIAILENMVLFIHHHFIQQFMDFFNETTLNLKSLTLSFQSGNQMICNVPFEVETFVQAVARSVSSLSSFCCYNHFGSSFTNFSSIWKLIRIDHIALSQIKLTHLEMTSLFSTVPSILIEWNKDTVLSYVDQLLDLLYSNKTVTNLKIICKKSTCNYTTLVSLLNSNGTLKSVHLQLKSIAPGQGTEYIYNSTLTSLSISPAITLKWSNISSLLEYSHCSRSTLAPEFPFSLDQSTFDSVICKHPNLLFFYVSVAEADLLREYINLNFTRLKRLHLNFEHLPETHTLDLSGILRHNNHLEILSVYSLDYAQFLKVIESNHSSLQQLSGYELEGMLSLDNLVEAVEKNTRLITLCVSASALYSYDLLISTYTKILHREQLEFLRIQCPILFVDASECTRNRFIEAVESNRLIRNIGVDPRDENLIKYLNGRFKTYEIFPEYDIK